VIARFLEVNDSVGSFVVRNSFNLSDSSSDATFLERLLSCSRDSDLKATGRMSAPNSQVQERFCD